MVSRSNTENVDLGKSRRSRSLASDTLPQAALLCLAWNPFWMPIWWSGPLPTPIDRRATTTTQDAGRSEAQAGLPIASGPSLFVQPGIDLRHQDRTQGKFPGLRLSRQSAEVAAARSDPRAPLQ